MEKLVNKLCGGMPHNCNLNREEKLITKTETTVNRPVQSSTEDKKDQKPWSVFEDLYWI